MTTATRTFTFANSSGVAAQTWISGIRDLILAAGLVQSSDTGQLDISTAPSSFGNNADYGFHVFKFPDTLQATTPIFVRLSYYADSTARALVGVKVSGATNGAGTLATPLLSTNENPPSSLQASLTSYACYVDGTFTMVLGQSVTSGATTNNCVAALVVDRARSSAGVAQAAGFLVEAAQQPLSPNVLSRSMYGASSPAVGAGFVPSLVPDTNAVSSSEGANVNVFRHYMMVPGVRPSLGCLTYFNAEFGALTPFTATVLGSSHTYLPMGVAMTNWSANAQAAHCAAIRWE